MSSKDKLRLIPGGPATKVDLLSPNSRERSFARFLAEQEVVYDYAKSAYLVQGEKTPLPRLMNYLFERGNVNQWVEDANPPRLARLLELWTDAEEKRVKNEVRTRILPCNQERGEEALRDWLALICREGDKGKDYTATMMRQFFWQVKRTLADRARWDHVMLVFQGKQELGKSRAIEQMLSPIAPLWDKWTLSTITDERHYTGLERNYVGYVTEMRGGRAAELEALKSIITEPTITMRWLGTNMRTTLQQNCSFVGDTNKDVASIIKDDENRRMWEVRFKDRRHLNMERVLDFPYSDFWLLEDAESETSPLQRSGHRDLIRAAQTDELGTPEPALAWLREIGLGPGEHKVLSADLYSTFRAWANLRGLPSGTETSFGRRIGTILLKGRGRVGKGRGSYYTCDKSCQEILKLSK